MGHGDRLEQPLAEARSRTMHWESTLLRCMYCKNSAPGFLERNPSNTSQVRCMVCRATYNLLNIVSWPHTGILCVYCSANLRHHPKLPHIIQCEHCANRIEDPLCDKCELPLWQHLDSAVGKIWCITSGAHPQPPPINPL